MTGRETMSSFKLGLSIFWSACWTALLQDGIRHVVHGDGDDPPGDQARHHVSMLLLMSPVSVPRFS